MMQTSAMSDGMFVLVCALIVAAIPLAMRKVPLNSFYGFRTPKAMSSPQMWLDANRKAGVNLIVAGVFTLAAWGILRVFWGAATLHAMGVPIMGASFVVALIVSFIQLHRM